MQWIFTLIGLVLGWTLDESFYDAGIGALLGLGIGQAIRLSKLATQADQQARQLETTQKALIALGDRLRQLEVPAPPSNAIVEAPIPEPTPVAKAPELVWELPVELAPVAMVAEPSQPLPADVWAPAPTPQPEEPAIPRGPNLIERAISGARNWLFGGNTVLRVGVVLLFLGLAFLLRYATEGMVVPIELRYAGVAAAALGLLGLGWWLRLRNSNYALMLQGTGIAVLYLTVFAAMRLHPLIDPGAALGLLVAVTVFSAILAITQDALGLACAAALGGFAAPILTSTGAGNHVALFSYFALLNAGILAIAWFKAWRLLNLIGFVGTFGIGFAWGMRSYTPELLWSTEPFLILFFLMYLAIGLLFARRKLLERGDAPEGREALLRWSAAKGDYVDGCLLFGPPLVGFGLQFALVQHLEFAAAFSALGLGIIYMGLARLLSGGRALLLAETCLALGVIFASLAIPLGLDARWTAAAWAVEGAGIFWLGLRQQRPLARAFGVLLQLGSALAFLSEVRVGELTLLEGAPLGALLLGAALLFSYDQLRKAPTQQAAPWERKGLPVLASLGLSCMYLLAPLLLLTQGTAISWAIAGLVTLFVGLRIGSRTFLFSAFAVQLLGGVLFLLRLQGGDGAAVFNAGWSGLLSASLIGLALVGGMLLAARDDMVRGDVRLLRGLSVVLLAGLVLINLAVLFVLPWESASGVWAASGLLIIWLSLYLQQRVSFVFGLLLQLVGGASFLLAVPELLGPLTGEGLRPLAHSGFWTPMVLGLAALVGAWCLQREPHAPAFTVLKLQRLSDVLLVWGAGWWTLALAGEVLRFIPKELLGACLLGLAAVSVAIWALLSVRLHWASLGVLCTLLMPAAGVALLVSASTYYHPAANYGWLAWLAVFGVHFISLRRLASVVPRTALSIAHVLGCWMLIGMLALELRYGLLRFSAEYNAWRWLGWAILPSLYLVLAAAPRNWPWPVSTYSREYRVLAAVPLAVLMLGWFWLANIFSDGTAKPLPYVPLVNPLDLGLLFALLGVYLLSRSVAPQRGPRAELLVQGVAGVSLFAFFTALVMRTAHHWGGVPFHLDALLASMLVQAGLSIVWTLIALSLMIGGHLRHRREVWLIGAALIAVVVAKLFFVELSNRGGLARIVSFIGVGGLLLVVGYFAPLPPKRADPVVETQGASS
ncbi:DUF2339 domain-containing protein [Pseudomonas syringae]|uniref:DUF2339 domain-containing protein n=1 Tax=Pseudomonas syringae TaxID=317 RepID=A0A9Q3X670_PSESX|nr:DUF2339 domain-containing protein [Pseudomonas syringae]MCF5063392.1 DUF2339 domain-containing protein [Pseudomonas syringae]MCF5073576.1 DUF2339 domain-containing protein [Pseudomonas syringae]MCF5119874.1 DUF2339 domain-containing protein [Pseudomonas syringae]MCF5377042.1 DUF2339 domain-containing protein [Pseudomonas syringae]